MNEDGTPEIVDEPEWYRFNPEGGMDTLKYAVMEGDYVPMTLAAFTMMTTGIEIEEKIDEVVLLKTEEMESIMTQAGYQRF